MLVANSIPGELTIGQLKAAVFLVWAIKIGVYFLNSAFLILIALYKFCSLELISNGLRKNVFFPEFFRPYLYCQQGFFDF